MWPDLKFKHFWPGSIYYDRYANYYGQIQSLVIVIIVIMMEKIIPDACYCFPAIVDRAAKLVKGGLGCWWVCRASDGHHLPACLSLEVHLSDGHLPLCSGRPL